MRGNVIETPNELLPPEDSYMHRGKYEKVGQRFLEYIKNAHRTSDYIHTFPLGA